MPIINTAAIGAQSAELARTTRQASNYFGSMAQGNRPLEITETQARDFALFFAVLAGMFEGLEDACNE